MSLNTGVGKELLRHLCPECKTKLEQEITEKDIKRCVKSPFGYKRLVKKIEDNTCPSCQQKIWSKGVQI
jgi:uncharacterized protein with PIN domain